MEKQTELLNFVENEIKRLKLGGFALGTIDYDKKVSEHYFGSYGNLSGFYNQKINKYSLYDIASLTKVVGVTTRILQLIELNKLQFETRVDEILDDFPFPNIDIESLLFHNSGLSADLTIVEGLTKENFFEKIKSEYNTIRGTVYSDLGFIVLGMIIEEVDKTSLEESFKKNIFKQADMDCISYKTDVDVHNYVPTEMSINRGIIQGKVHDPKAFAMGDVGSAGLFSNLHSLMMFSKSMLFDEKLVSLSTKKLLISKVQNNRGLGWEKPYEDGILYHTGFTGTSIYLDFSRKVAFVLLVNRCFPERSKEFLEVRKDIHERFREYIK